MADVDVVKAELSLGFVKGVNFRTPIRVDLDLELLGLNTRIAVTLDEHEFAQLLSGSVITVIPDFSPPIKPIVVSREA